MRKSVLGCWRPHLTWTPWGVAALGRFLGYPARELTPAMEALRFALLPCPSPSSTGALPQGLRGIFTRQPRLNALGLCPKCPDAVQFARAVRRMTFAAPGAS